ncbi:uncharacterized protein LOC125145374 isoform X2 [Tachysurus fulvidraco]|uniref:uncharacterized protein LOC125145374 isoform X2 n=1 Tax=Tachysurus fulvidraco TaxID=1234273 RepID=UPI001FEE70F6|nr:uncharacterized protein LOC125145374 isoform X2 [Tachysurus fulvidraco]
MNPSPPGRSIQPGYTSRNPRPSPYPRPAHADPMAGYRRFQLRHIISELTTLLEQLSSPELPEHAYLLSHIVRNAPVLTSSSQTTLVNLVDSVFNAFLGSGIFHNIIPPCETVQSHKIYVAVF